MVSPRSENGPVGVGEEISPDHLFRVTGLTISSIEKQTVKEEPSSTAADFEEAIAATGYGRFNVILMLCTFPAFWSAVAVSSSVSYIFTRAKCDMNLSLIDMGTLTAITYGGMISSAMVWGFLSDTLGRRRIMAWGFLASGLVELVAALSQNFAMLVVTRYLAGFMFNGPFAVLLSYIAEMHRTEFRAPVMLYTCLFFTFANTTLPLLAWAILTQDVEMKFFGGNFVIGSWNLFMASAGLIPVLTGLIFFCMPESPKFLMSRGRNEEALAIFQRIYSANSGRPAEEYPIQKLAKERSGESAVGVAALRGGFRQLAPLFRPPHALWLVLLCAVHAGCMFGSNTLRLWFPQLAAMIGTDSGESLCAAISPKVNASPLIPEEVELCTPIATSMSTYLQSAAVGAGSIISYGVGGFLVNRCGKKRVAGLCSLFCAVTVIMLPLLGKGAFSVVALMTVSQALTSLAGASLSSIAVDLFPTSLRVMAMAMFLMFGRVGTITGTVAFPALMAYGCLPPFITIAAVMTACGISAFFLPNTTLKKME